MAQSSDPDADAVMASFDHPEAAKDADAATVLASFDQPPTPRSGSDVVKDLIHSKVSHGIASVGGGLREIGDLATGSSMEQADRRYRQFVQDNTYQPTDPTSQALIKVNQRAESSPLNPVTWPARAANAGSDLWNAATGSTTVGPVLAGAGQGLLGVMGMRSGSSLASDFDTQAALDAAAANSKQSMGAAAAAPKLGSLPPELQQAVRDAVQKTGGAINPDVFTRHAEAASLPVPMRLSEGQAVQDPHIISREMNNRGTPGNPTAENLNRQNQQLTENLQAIRDRVGPDVFTTNAVEHGDTLIKAYKDKAAQADAVTDGKYQALRDAAGGQFPVDAKLLMDNASKQLHDKLLFEHAPSGPLSQLARMADSNNMTFEQFESLRTNLARIQRSATDGNERAAAGVIRSAMEELPLKGEAAKLKPLADDARQTARAQFQALEADPAYKAAVNESVPPDRFVHKFVIGGTRDGVAQMRENLAHDDTALQTMGVSALDHLRDQARVGPGQSGNFAQAAFNKQLVALDPKLRSLVDPKTADQLGTLGNVAHYTQNQPRGSYVNNSNTAVALFGEHAANLAEKSANAVLGGGIVPVGSMVRKGFQNRAIAKEAERSWAPGAGLTNLSDVAKK